MVSSFYIRGGGFTLQGVDCCWFWIAWNKLLMKSFFIRFTYSRGLYIGHRFSFNNVLYGISTALVLILYLLCLYHMVQLLLRVRFYTAVLG